MASRTPEAEVVQVLPSLYALRSFDRFPVHALAVVRSVVGGDKGDYTEVDLASGDFRVLVDPEPPQLAALGEARIAYMHEHPVLAHVRAGATGVHAISDFLTRTEFHRSNVYGEFFKALGVEAQVTVADAAPDSRELFGISLDRQRSGFGARERQVMSALQPHIAAARLNAKRFSHALAESHLKPPGAGASSTLERLTGRQFEVLAEAARGATNAQIARHLDISPGTVREHMEHILRRLEVTSRTAAAVLYLRTTTASREAVRWTASEAALLG